MAVENLQDFFLTGVVGYMLLSLLKNSLTKLSFPTPDAAQPQIYLALIHSQAKVSKTQLLSNGCFQTWNNCLLNIFTVNFKASLVPLAIIFDLLLDNGVRVFV